MMPVSMSGGPDIGESLGRPDFAPDCDCNRVLRPTPGGGSRPPAGRDSPGAEDLAALPARGHTLAQPDRDSGSGERLDPAAVAHTLGPDGPAGAGARPDGRHAAGPSRSDPGRLLRARQTRKGISP